MHRPWTCRRCLGRPSQLGLPPSGRSAAGRLPQPAHSCWPLVGLPPAPAWAPAMTPPPGAAARTPAVHPASLVQIPIACLLTLLLDSLAGLPCRISARKMNAQSPLEVLFSPACIHLLLECCPGLAPWQPEPGQAAEGTAPEAAAAMPASWKPAAATRSPPCAAASAAHSHPTSEPAHQQHPLSSSKMRQESLAGESLASSLCFAHSKQELASAQASICSASSDHG